MGIPGNAMGAAGYMPGMLCMGCIAPGMAMPGDRADMGVHPGPIIAYGMPCIIWNCRMHQFNILTQADLEMFVVFVCTKKQLCFAMHMAFACCVWVHTMIQGMVSMRAWHGQVGVLTNAVATCINVHVLTAACSSQCTNILRSLHYA